MSSRPHWAASGPERTGLCRRMPPAPGSQPGAARSAPSPGRGPPCKGDRANMSGQEAKGGAPGRCGCDREGPARALGQQASCGLMPSPGQVLIALVLGPGGPRLPTWLHVHRRALVLGAGSTPQATQPRPIPIPLPASWLHPWPSPHSADLRHHTPSHLSAHASGLFLRRRPSDL